MPIIGEPSAPVTNPYARVERDRGIGLSAWWGLVPAETSTPGHSDVRYSVPVAGRLGGGEGCLVIVCRQPYRPRLERVDTGGTARSRIHMPYISQARARNRDTMRCYLWYICKRWTDYVSVNALKKPPCQKSTPPLPAAAVRVLSRLILFPESLRFSCPLQGYLMGIYGYRGHTPPPSVLPTSKAAMAPTKDAGP